MSKHAAPASPLTNAPLSDGSGDDALYAGYVRDKIKAGLDSLAEGQGVPHDEARRRMGKWLDD